MVSQYSFQFSGLSKFTDRLFLLFDSYLCLYYENPLILTCNQNKEQTSQINSHKWNTPAWFKSRIWKGTQDNGKTYDSRQTLHAGPVRTDCFWFLLTVEAITILTPFWQPIKQRPICLVQIGLYCFDWAEIRFLSDFQSSWKLNRPGLSVLKPLLLPSKQKLAGSQRRDARTPVCPLFILQAKITYPTA